MNITFSRLISCLAAIALGSIVCAEAQWTFTNLSPNGAAESFVRGVFDGQQVGSATVGGPDQHACLWNGTSASWVSLKPEGATNSYANCTSGAKQGGNAIFGGTSHAGLWTGTAATWVDLHPPVTTQSAIEGMDSDQQVGSVTLCAQGCSPRASLWSGTAESWIDLTPMSAKSSQARAVHGGYQVGSAFVDHNHASLWNGTPESWVDLHPPVAYSSEGHGVFKDQQVGSVYVAGSTGSHASIWHGTAASWMDIHPPIGATDSAVWATCKTHQVGWARFGSNSHASVWTGTPESFIDLHTLLPPGFSSSHATSVWSDGSFVRVAGYGYNNFMSRYDALLWTYGPLPLPCPGDITGDDVVNVIDLLLVINLWGNPRALDGIADINRDGFVNVLDLLAVISGWGPCP